VAQIEQQREISDDMNVLAGGREISGYMPSGYRNN